jgi:hypothetical protein
MMFAMEFRRGALREPSVSSFEGADELARTLHRWDLISGAQRAGAVDRPHSGRARQIEETGDLDLRVVYPLGLAIDSIGAKHVVLDTCRRCSVDSRTSAFSARNFGGSSTG